MELMYGSPSQAQESQQSDSSSESQSSGAADKMAETSKSLANSAPGKILSTGGLLMIILLSLLLGLAYVVRSLKNIKLSLRLMLKRDDRAEKKY